MTNHNVIQDALYGEAAINDEHILNNKSVRQVLAKRGIKPESLQPEVDIKKLERHVKSEGKKLAKVSGRLPENGATDQSTYPKIDEK